MAVLFFDPYGRSCATALHTNSLQDRQGDHRAPWFASAQIPLQAIKGSLHLQTKCIALKPRFFYEEEGIRREHKKYLVTEIAGSSWPLHYPIIGHSRTNAADDAPNPERVEADKPYKAPPKPKDGDSSTTVTQGEDANAQTSTTTMRGSEWSWLMAPPVLRKLEKKYSKRYLGERGAPQDDNGTRVSNGEHTHEQEAVSKGEAKTLVHKHLLALFAFPPSVPA